MQMLDVLTLSGSAVAAFLSIMVYFKTSNRERPRMLARVISKKTQANMDMWARDGVFKNYFFVKLLFANQSSLPNALLGAKSYFLIEDQWKEGEILCEEGFSLPSNISPLSTIPFNINAITEVVGEPGKDNNTRARSHDSLPDPLYIRIEFEALAGTDVTVDFEYHRPPLKE